MLHIRTAVMLDIVLGELVRLVGTLQYLFIQRKTAVRDQEFLFSQAMINCQLDEHAL